MKQLTLLTVLLLAPWAALYATDVVNLPCEYREKPFGIDVVKPRLSWIVEGQSDKGTGYRGTDKGCERDLQVQ
jgi:hypothetical protein